ncbi:MAG: hypothetical protein WBW37_08580, partial [Methyloceanibacter sp.]
MAGRYTGSYLDRSNGWRAVATLADIGRASLVGRIPKESIRTLPGRRQQDSVLINRGNRNIVGSQRIRFALMRYSLHEIDRHDVVVASVAADRDEALEWFSEKLRLMLSFERIISTLAKRMTASLYAETKRTSFRRQNRRAKG